MDTGLRGPVRVPDGARRPAQGVVMSVRLQHRARASQPLADPARPATPHRAPGRAHRPGPQRREGKRWFEDRNGLILLGVLLTVVLAFAALVARTALAGGASFLQ